jgi:hypothetical protein
MCLNHYGKEYRKKNQDRYRRYEAKRKGDPERKAKARIASKKKYRQSTRVTYREAQLARQGGCCDLCGADRHGGLNWHLDHSALVDPRPVSLADPRSYRGVLCMTCNSMVVFVAESSPFHRKNMVHADAYLTRWEKVIAQRFAEAA